MRSPGADQVLLHGVVLFDAAFATVQLAVFSGFQFPRHSAQLHQQTLPGPDLQSALALEMGRQPRTF
jgi:hypothetical protein